MRVGVRGMHRQEQIVARVASWNVATWTSRSCSQRACAIFHRLRDGRGVVGVDKNHVGQVVQLIGRRRARSHVASQQATTAVGAVELVTMAQFVRVFFDASSLTTHLPRGHISRVTPTDTHTDTHPPRPVHPACTRTTRCAPLQVHAMYDPLSRRARPGRASAPSRSPAPTQPYAL